MWLKGKCGFVSTTNLNDIELLKKIKENDLAELVIDENINIGKYNALNRCRIISKDDITYIGKNNASSIEGLRLIGETTAEMEKVYLIIKVSPFPLTVAEIVKIYIDEKHTTETNEKNEWNNTINLIYQSISEESQEDVILSLQERVKDCSEMPLVVSAIERLLKMKKIELE